MKWIIMTAVIAGMSGVLSAVDFQDLQRLRACEIGAQAAAWHQIPQIPPTPPTPQPPGNTIDTCVFTHLNEDLCYFKCKSGDTITEPPIKTNTATGDPAKTCATHIFLTRPDGQFKTAKTVADRYSSDLQAADGTRVFVDYAPVNLGGAVTASPVWVSVRNPKFNGSEKVKARLMTYYEATSYSADALKETAELELPYTGYDFQVKAPNVGIYEAHHSWRHNFRQEIAVSVNGVWLTDPVSGTPNFKFKMTGSPAAGRSVNKSADKGIKACLFKETQGDTCAYKCDDGSGYTRPMATPSPWGDEPVVPCPAVVFPF